MKSEQRRGQGQEPWGTIILKGERRKSRQRKLNRNSQSWKETKIKWCLEGQRGTFKKKRMVHGVQCSETQLDEGYRVSPGSPSTLTLPRPPLQKSEWFSPKCRSDQVTLCLNPSVADHCLQNKVHTPYLEFKTPHYVFSVSLASFIFCSSARYHTLIPLLMCHFFFKCSSKYVPLSRLWSPQEQGIISISSVIPMPRLIWT